MNADIRDLVEAVLLMIGARPSAGGTDQAILRELDTLNRQQRPTEEEAGKVIARMIGAEASATSSSDTVETIETLGRQRTQARSSSNTGASLASAATGLLGSGLGVLSLFRGVFGGGESRTAGAAEFTKLALPPTISADLGYSAAERGFVEIARSGSGVVKEVGDTQSREQQITINVQAMDSRSFMDHSSEIANAVRQALLHSESLSDVLTEF